MKKEKRRFSRIPFKMHAELTVDNVTYPVHEINNLSIGGASFPVRADFEADTACQAKIFLEGRSSELSIEVSGKVVRCSPEAVAVQFTRIDPDSLFHLQNVIRYNAPDPEVIEKEIQKHPGLI